MRTSHILERGRIVLDDCTGNNGHDCAQEELAQKCTQHGEAARAAEASARAHAAHVARLDTEGQAHKGELEQMVRHPPLFMVCSCMSKQCACVSLGRASRPRILLLDTQAPFASRRRVQIGHVRALKDKLRAERKVRKASEKWLRAELKSRVRRVQGYSSAQLQTCIASH